jgi:hypothetical protein
LLKAEGIVNQEFKLFPEVEIIGEVWIVSPCCGDVRAAVDVLPHGINCSGICSCL